MGPSFFLFFGIIFVGVILFTVVLLLLVRWVATSKQRQQRKLNLQSPILTAPARVVDERSAVYGSSGQYGGTTTTSYFATFELADGRRLEFEITGQQAGQLVVGDTGNITWQGTWLQGFQRGILR